MEDFEFYAENGLVRRQVEWSSHSQTANNAEKEAYVLYYTTYISFNFITCIL